MPLIKTFEEACGHLLLDPATAIPDFSCYPERHQKAMIAHSKLVLIAEALNDGWQPNWENSRQYKYYPWFSMSTAGVGFSCTYYVSWNSHSCVGSRLCYKTSDIAKYAGTTFLDIYNDYFTL